MHPRVPFSRVRGWICPCKFCPPLCGSHIRTQSTDAAWQESFNSRLKAEGDESSTNLYISNLPKHMNEMVSARHVPWRPEVTLVPGTHELTQPQQELGSIFAGYTILSSKILRDSMGNSRGVGFARYVGSPFVLVPLPSLATSILTRMPASSLATFVTWSLRSSTTTRSSRTTMGRS